MSKKRPTRYTYAIRDNGNLSLDITCHRLEIDGDRLIAWEDHAIKTSVGLHQHAIVQLTSKEESP